MLHIRRTEALERKDMRGIGMIEKIKQNRLLMLLLLTGAVYFFLKVIAPLTAPVLTAILFVTIFGSFLHYGEPSRICEGVGFIGDGVVFICT